MKIFDYTITIDTEIQSKLHYYNHYYSDENILFFDIETTGFVAKNTTLYLIGALWYDENKVYIRQWFNDTGYDEKEILVSFLAFSKTYTLLVHFNGCKFDLPYLGQKATKYELDYTLDTNLYQLDILKEIRPYKNILFLENLKQKTIEQYLGIQREDQYTGGELINVYQRFVASQDEEKEHLLLLHNYDDLVGMLSLSTILHYKAFFDRLNDSDLAIKNVSISEGNIILEYLLPIYASLGKRLTRTVNHIYLNTFEQYATLQIPIINTELKHFFKDYKNYYYLPNEDMAIHKSVATYVESANRVKATKSNCYTKCTSSFVQTYFTDDINVFQEEFDSKNLYMEVELLLNDEAILKKYVIALHKYIKKQ